MSFLCILPFYQLLTFSMYKKKKKILFLISLHLLCYWHFFCSLGLVEWITSDLPVDKMQIILPLCTKLLRTFTYRHLVFISFHIVDLLEIYKEYIPIFNLWADAETKLVDPLHAMANAFDSNSSSLKSLVRISCDA